MRPGIEVKEKWRPHVVIASRALSHRPNTLPLLYLQCCGHCTVSMELEAAVPLQQLAPARARDTPLQGAVNPVYS